MKKAKADFACLVRWSLLVVIWLSSEVEGSSARHILLARTQIERTIDWLDEFAVAHAAAVGHPTTR
jgi:hypothetical protein